ncbi:hypothetical protein [Agromyces sp. NPDC058126]|uniref:hypothetical protein n=1 Tax=Agromyces sp. NPDC058126 TaxID=3346350 RepID=UPI0036DF6746
MSEGDVIADRSVGLDHFVSGAAVVFPVCSTAMDDGEVPHGRVWGSGVIGGWTVVLGRERLHGRRGHGDGVVFQDPRMLFHYEGVCQECDRDRRSLCRTEFIELRARLADGEARTDIADEMRVARLETDGIDMLIHVGLYDEDWTDLTRVPAGATA